MGRGAWLTTTHEWAHDVDTEHLVEARRAAESLGEALPAHLVLEVIAYADDEAEFLGRPGAVVVTLGEGSVEVADDGRGTDTRRDEDGHIVRKPVMATRDVRFFDSEAPPLLPDGLPRRGMSTVAAVSPLLVHENRRREGAWRQAYRFGVPDSALEEVESGEGAGTRVEITLPEAAEVDPAVIRQLAEGFGHVDVSVLD